VIGVTCEDIETWRKVKANAWVMEEIKKRTLVERLHALIHESDAALALPGGPGTLAEISLMWNLMVVESLHRRPLILIGDGWQSVFDQFFKGLDAYVPAHQREILKFAKDAHTAVEMLEN
jgi:predicted Rossmann-fold nucleotide-binding protein